MGRQFSYELLSTVAGLPRENSRRRSPNWFDPNSCSAEARIRTRFYIFKRALVRDAAYSGLLKSRRAALHATIADAFEQRFPEVVEAQPETLAHHLTEAGLIEKAESYWLEASRKAAMRSANLEAIAHAQRGIETLAYLPDGSERDRRELDFQFALGPCLIATSRSRLEHCDRDVRPRP